MAGTNRSQQVKTGGPRVVLVEPQLGENIGACARAMLNCGMTELALVKPREAWPNERAEAMAAGATQVLDGAELYDTLEAAIGDLEQVYAATARPRDIILRTVTAREAAVEIRTAMAKGIKTGILFGPERSGLTNDHLTHIDTVISIPLNPAYASLNLAQAVLLVGYEIAFDDFDAAGRTSFTEDMPPPANKAELENFVDRLEAELATRGYFPNGALRISMARTLHTIFQRGRLTSPELQSLHGVISTLINPRERGKP